MPKVLIINGSPRIKGNTSIALDEMVKVFEKEQKQINGKIAVEVKPLKNFYTAEEYHQDYLDKHPTGYCHLPAALFEYARKAKMKK